MDGPGSLLCREYLPMVLTLITMTLITMLLWASLSWQVIIIIYGLYLLRYVRFPMGSFTVWGLLTALLMLSRRGSAIYHDAISPIETPEEWYNHFWAPLAMSITIFMMMYTYHRRMLRLARADVGFLGGLEDVHYQLFCEKESERSERMKACEDRRDSAIASFGK